MGITIKELLQMKEFSRYQILCGAHGLNRMVSSVSVMDAPDIYRWLDGGEVLLTSGYILQSHLDFMEELVEKVAEKNAAALFIKLGRYIHELPQNVVRKAEQLDFPIIAVPYDVTWVNIINPVLAEINEQQLKEIRHSERIHRIFTNIAVQQGGIPKVLKYLSELVHQDVAFVSAIGLTQETYFSSPGLEFHKESYIREYTCFPVNGNQKLYGYIVVLDPHYQAQNYDLISIEHATTIIQLELQKQISNDAVERKYRDNFVMDLIFQYFSTMEEVDERGRLFGWHFSGAYRVMIADVDHLREKYFRTERRQKDIDLLYSSLCHVLIQKVQKVFPGSIYSIFTDHVVFLIPDTDYRPEWIKKELYGINKNMKNEKGFSLLFAFGNRVPDIYQVSKSYREAQTALKMERKFGGENGVCFYEQLGMYRLLDQLKENPAVQCFLQDEIQRLKEYDRSSNSELYVTLRKIICCNWNLKEASEQLYLHYNTMKKRFHKIEEVMQIDLSCMEKRLELEFAFRFRFLLEKE